METLQKQITELKAGRTLKQLKLEDAKTYYRVKGLSSKLNALKAASKQQFINKDHLVEYKGLIVWIMKNKCNYKGCLNLKSAMTELLNNVNKQRIVYKSSSSIKGIVCKLATSAALHVVEQELRERNGIDSSTNSYGVAILEDFNQFRINTLM